MIDILPLILPILSEEEAKKNENAETEEITEEEIRDYLESLEYRL